MNKEQGQWTQEYARLQRAGDYEALVDHIRANVNLSKEVLISANPTIQQEFTSMMHERDALLKLARDTIVGLSEQQAQPDDWWHEPLTTIDAALQGDGVPREPTEAMIDAGMRYMKWQAGALRGVAADMYRAMYDAAPKGGEVERLRAVLDRVRSRVIWGETSEPTRKAVCALIDAALQAEQPKL